MAGHKQTLLARCPLCGQGAIEASRERLFFASQTGSKPCPACGAVFVPAGRGRLRLRYCDPQVVANRKGRKYPESACGECIVPEQCLLDKTLSESEWEKVAQGQPPDIGSTEERVRLESGILPVLAEQIVPISLELDEVVHRVALVYLWEQHGSVTNRDACRLVLTDRRVVFVHEGGSFEIRLADVGGVMETIPGFAIYLGDGVQPIQCFPAPGDLIYSAMVGALRNFRQGKRKDSSQSLPRKGSP